MVAAGNHDIDKQENEVEIFQQIHPAEIGTYDSPLGSLSMKNPPYSLP